MFGVKMPFIGGLVFCMYIHDKHDKIDEYHGHFFISRWEVRHKTCGAPRALYQGAFPPHAARRAGRLAWGYDCVALRAISLRDFKIGLQ